MWAYLFARYQQTPPLYQSQIAVVKCVSNLKVQKVLSSIHIRGMQDGLEPWGRSQPLASYMWPVSRYQRPASFVTMTAYIHLF